MRLLFLFFGTPTHQTKIAEIEPVLRGSFRFLPFFETAHIYYFAPNLKLSVDVVSPTAVKGEEYTPKKREKIYEGYSNFLDFFFYPTSSSV